MTWLVADLINLLILARVIYKAKQDLGFVNVPGCVHLTFFSMLMGPIFTALSGFVYMIERYE